MAFGSTVEAKGGVAWGGATVHPASRQSHDGWLTVATNFEGTTAQTATQLRRPMAATATNSNPVNIPDGMGRFWMRARYPIAATAVTTHPEVWVYGMKSKVAEWVEGTTDFERLDQLGSESGNTRITVVPDATAAGGDYNDATYRYSAVTSQAGIDCAGCRSLLVLQAIQTALATITTGVDIQIKFGN